MANAAAAITKQRRLASLVFMAVVWWWEGLEASGGESLKGGAHVGGFVSRSGFSQIGEHAAST